MPRELSNLGVAAAAAELRSEWERLPAGSRLPSDRALADRLGMGRGVIGRLMADLAREGLVRRQRGAGTFWLGVAEEIAPTSIPSFSATMQRSGVVAGFRLISQETRRVTSTEREYLRLPANSTVWRIQRVFTVDDIPVGVATSVLPVRDLQRLPGELLSYGSLYDTLTRRYRVDPVRTWKRRRAIESPRFVADALGLRGPVPARFEESLNGSVDGGPIEYARTFFRGDHLSPERLVRLARTGTTDRQEHRPR